jgi:hypothetical protein
VKMREQAAASKQFVDRHALAEVAQAGAHVE